MTQGRAGAPRRVAVGWLTEEERKGIRDAVLCRSVALLAVRVQDDHEVVDWAASGTLVSVRGAPCVLTAGHVAAGLLRYETVGLGIVDYPHRHALSTKLLRIVEVGTPAKGWGAEGPDLAVLVLPQQEFGQIQARPKLFYDLDKRREAGWADPERRKSAFWAMAGFPAERSKVGRQHSVAEGVVGVAQRVTCHETDGFHFIDMEVSYVPPADPPQNFEGMSGSGLWLLPTERDEEGSPRWSKRILLAGVAFYQTDRDEESRTIRCHGPEDVYGHAYEAVKKELHAGSEELRKKWRRGEWGS